MNGSEDKDDDDDSDGSLLDADLHELFECVEEQRIEAPGSKRAQVEVAIVHAQATLLLVQAVRDLKDAIEVVDEDDDES